MLLQPVALCWNLEQTRHRRNERCPVGACRSCRTRLVTRRVRPASKSAADGGSPGMLSASEAFAAAAAYGAAAAAAASAPASSPAASLHAAAATAPAHACSVLSVDAAPMQLRDQQGWSHSVAPSPPLQQEQLQQPEGAAGPLFEGFLPVVIDGELQQIMQQDAAAQPPASVLLGAVSAPVPVPAAVQSATLLGGTAPASTAAGLGKTASTGSAMFGATAATALAPGLQAGGEDIVSAGTGADMDLIERAALRRQQLLLQAKQLLEEERQLRELASSTSDEATARLTDALLAGDCFAPSSDLAAMQPGRVADGSSGGLLAPPVGLPGVASRLQLPQGAAAAPLPQETGERPSHWASHLDDTVSSMSCAGSCIMLQPRCRSFRLWSAVPSA
jgi:hypothetical protein